jgi:hypothetical protein
VTLGEISGQQRIGRRADQCSHPAYARGVGKPQKQREGKAPRIVIAPVCLLDRGDHRDRNREHENHRRGVADPHRQEAAGDHEAQHDPARPGSYCGDHGKGQTSMQSPALHGYGDDEPAEEQEDQRICIWR